MSYVRSIPVRDANGDEFTLYEFQQKRLLRKVRRWKLCTGEAVEMINGELIVTATGETLVTQASDN